MLELILKTPIEKLTDFMIEFNNEEIIKDMLPKLERYKTTIYTDEQIPEAKADRAQLNKFKDSIEDWRKKIKKACMQPYDKFEEKIKQITSLIDDSSHAIDNQVKNFENTQKEQKLTQILEIFNKYVGNLKNVISLEQIFNNTWLNATVSIKKIDTEIKTIIDQVEKDLLVITNLKSKHETHLKDYYLTRFDLSSTLLEKTRLEEQEQKLAELSQKQPAEPPTPQINTNTQEAQSTPVNVVDFRVWATDNQLLQIKQFLKLNNIKYGRVE